ncbi:MAG: hypothetical protein Q7K16_03495 [Candidatus Azambacteria bacterium]|nr:hypothetical protein [Candidatus Azambacteria bacterium]
MTNKITGGQVAKRIALASIGGLLIALSLGTTVMAAVPKARLNYVSQTARSVNVVYMNMQPATEIMYVNKTSGKKFPRQRLLIEGNGTFSVPIASSMPAGEYYLLAQNMKHRYVAQTVTFYITRGNPGPTL